MFFFRNKINLGTKSAIIYTLATLFSRGLAIITVPIFTRIMTTEQIGVVNIYNSWYLLLSSIATLSLTSGGYMVALKEYSDRRDEYQSSVLSLTSIIAIIMAIIFFITPRFWENIFGLSKPLIILMLIGFLFAPARDFWLARQRYEYRYKIPAMVTVLSAIIASALSVWAVVFFNSKNPDQVVNGRLFSNYLVIYGVAAIIWMYTMLNGKTLYHKEFWKLSLTLSLPLVGYSIASQILSVSDRMMISRMVDNSAVGIYSTLYTVSSLSLMVWSAIHSSFVPYLFQNIEKRKSGIKKVAFLLIGAYALCAILLAFFAPEIVRILAPSEYYSAIYIMPPIAAGVFLTSFANIYSDIAVYYKKTKYVMYPAIIAALSNVVLNYIFINIYGYMSAAYTTMASYIVLAICQGVWAKKICNTYRNRKMVFNDLALSILAVFTIIVIMLGMLLYAHTLIRYIVIIAIMGIIVICGLFYGKLKNHIFYRNNDI